MEMTLSLSEPRPNWPGGRASGGLSAQAVSPPPPSVAKWSRRKEAERRAESQATKQAKVEASEAEQKALLPAHAGTSGEPRQSSSAWPLRSSKSFGLMVPERSCPRFRVPKSSPDLFCPTLDVPVSTTCALPHRHPNAQSLKGRGNKAGETSIGTLPGTGHSIYLPKRAEQGPRPGYPFLYPVSRSGGAPCGGFT
jgi:hypothetical protein